MAVTGRYLGYDLDGNMYTVQDGVVVLWHYRDGQPRILAAGDCAVNTALQLFGRPGNSPRYEDVLRLLEL